MAWFVMVRLRIMTINAVIMGVVIIAKIIDYLKTNEQSHW
jgi:hypothetical protein